MSSTLRALGREMRLDLGDGARTCAPPGSRSGSRACCRRPASRPSGRSSWRCRGPGCRAGARRRRAHRRGRRSRPCKRCGRTSRRLAARRPRSSWPSSASGRSSTSRAAPPSLATSSKKLWLVLTSAMIVAPGWRVSTSAARICRIWSPYTIRPWPSTTPIRSPSPSKPMPSSKRPGHDRADQVHQIVRLGRDPGDGWGSCRRPRRTGIWWRPGSRAASAAMAGPAAAVAGVPDDARGAGCRDSRRRGGRHRRRTRRPAVGRPAPWAKSPARRRSGRAPGSASP